MDRQVFILVLVVLLCAGLGYTSGAWGQTVWYVDDDGPGGDGRSWETAFQILQDGLDAAVSEDEIWVAEGIYKPTSDYGFGIRDRGRHFRMINGVGIYGGFADTGVAVWEDRDPNIYITILSGDLLGNDNPATPVEGLFTDPTRSDNCYHVFYHNLNTNLNSTARLDGFTITGGNADLYTSSHLFGGGMYNEGSSPTVRNCNFRDNTAITGGGMYNTTSNAIITECIFTDNISNGGDGGGIYNNDSHPVVTQCVFVNNSARSGGGMMNYNFSSSMLIGCTFRGNTAGNGGGLYNHRGNSTLTSCLFVGNSANMFGGGIFNNMSGSPTVKNCTFSGNSAGSLGGGLCSQSENLVLTNTRFIDNIAPSGGGIFTTGSPTVTGCTFRGNSAEEGGGMGSNTRGNPIVTDCTFIGNSAIIGGGMNNYNSAYEFKSKISRPTVSNCTFADNTAEKGGGIYNAFCDPIISRCTFNGNIVQQHGGGMRNENSNAKISNCTFLSNSADQSGGGMSNSEGDSLVVGCIFESNQADGGGGGMSSNGGDSIVTNSVFWGNSSILGGGLFNFLTDLKITSCTFSGNMAYLGGGLYNHRYSNTEIINCILWGNMANLGGVELFNDRGYLATKLVIGYCDIGGCLPNGSWDVYLGIDGGGNIDADPIFVDTGVGDYRLKIGSPCIDAGSDVGVYEDIDGVVRPWDDPRVDHNGPGVGEFDMGAYEFVNGKPVGDAGGDLVVWAGINGLAIVRLDGLGSFDGDALTFEWRWVVDGEEFVSFSGDGVVNMLDYAEWAKGWQVGDIAGLAGFSGAWLSFVEVGSHFDLGSGAYLVVELGVGEYEVSLVVNDGVEDSEADTCLVTVLGAGDLDMDGVVGVEDLEILLAGRGQSASGEGDPRDLDGDGVITVLDGRILMTLFTQ